jgi:serine O-acetyltransferase
VGIPGRILYRAGERVGPLEHGSLPDTEAEVIRALLDRIENLERQVQKFQTEQTCNAIIQGVETPSVTEIELPPSCNLEDKIVRQFLDGSGI